MGLGDSTDVLVMSAPLAGKFQDHYVILGVEPRANLEAIQAAYQKAVEKYHPDNLETGSEEKFDAVNQAYETLCDPQLRAEFDKLKGIDKDDGEPTFSGVPFFASLGRQHGLRTAILSVLYDRRQKKPFRPSLSMRHLDNILIATEEELNFAIWYLKQKGLVESDDKSNLQIAVSGMDYLESKRPAPEVVMPYVKLTAITPAEDPGP